MVTVMVMATATVQATVDTPISSPFHLGPVCRVFVVVTYKKYLIKITNHEYNEKIITQQDY